VKRNTARRQSINYLHWCFIWVTSHLSLIWSLICTILCGVTGVSPNFNQAGRARRRTFDRPWPGHQTFRI
jgi:hypothetical protein